MGEEPTTPQVLGWLKAVTIIAALGLILAVAVATNVWHTKSALEQRLDAFDRDQARRQKRDDAQDKLNAIFINWMQSHQKN